MNLNGNCIQLFNDINNVAQEYGKMESLISSLKSIIQNPDFVKKEDIFQFNQECKMVTQLIDSNTKDCKKELGRIYMEINKLYEEL